jgi:rfaE bifunctional protein kinase chain/domain
MAVIENIVSGFPGRRVVVAGDLIADQFLNGTISRVSREAPVFILKHEHTDTLPGGAANAAANIAALGGQAVLIGVVGQDRNGEALVEKLNELKVDTGNILTDPSNTTTTKVRIVAGQHYAARQQVIRIDYENSSPLAETVENRLVDNLAAAASTADAIIISDYGCGAVFPALFEKAREIAGSRNVPLVVDSRYRLDEFTGATTATPNREEVEKILGEKFSVEDCSRLRRRLGYRSLVVTNGNQGMLLVEDGQQPVHIDAVGSKEPVDVTGAGDTVIAAYTLALACGASFADAADLANHAGGVVVMKKGTATVSSRELLDSIHTYKNLRASQQAK